MIAIEAKNISHHVEGFALNDINLAIPKEKITTIIGPNGSGKSTFLKIISQLLTCKCGEICIYDKPVECYKKKDFARTVSMLPQSKQSLPDITVKELVSYGRSPYKSLFQKGNTSTDEEIIEWAMEVTGTAKNQNRMFHSLSGGEQQKARIAMALAQKTGILLLDEPTTYLDIAHQIDVMEILQEINKEYKITIVMVLHELQQAAAYSDFLIALKGGCVADFGEPQSILTSEFLKTVYNIDASIRFEDSYPIIIPNKSTKGK